MKTTQYRILAAAMALRQFTGRELAIRADVNSNTVKTWLKRNAKYVERTNGQRASGPGGGRPSYVWRIRAEASSEATALLDGLWSTVRPELRDAERVQNALENPEVRDRTRLYLRRAGRARDEDMRSGALAKAAQWLSHEVRMQERFVSDGQEVPAAIAAETASLQRAMGGFEARVDRLRFDRRVDTDERITRWMVDSLDRWFGERPSNQYVPFDPLVISREKPLVPQLVAVLETVKNLAGISTDRFILGFLMSLGSVRTREAREAICDVLVEVGFESVADCLREQFITNGHQGAAPALFRVLAGLCAFPRLVAEEPVGLWLDSLAYTSILTYHLTPFYVFLLAHRPHTVRSRIVEEKGASLDHFDDLKESDPDYFDHLYEGLQPEVMQIFGQVEQWNESFFRTRDDTPTDLPARTSLQAGQMFLRRLTNA